MDNHTSYLGLLYVNSSFKKVVLSTAKAFVPRTKSCDRSISIPFDEYHRLNYYFCTYHKIAL
ncbi:MAG: hypothetical protein CLLPBCKN_007968 [Chroococcidiopsis cubana SAG 39.79]|nr:hypothetical protein [Chroococcidiopsis cubana SAG 39.79]